VRTRITLWLTATTAAALLLVAIATNASARTLSTSAIFWRAEWSSLDFSGGGGTIRCKVTLEGSFHSRTIAKVARALIGAVSRAIFAHPCTGGEEWADNGTEAEPLGTAPNRLPWHLTYESFTGTLPNISAINLLLSRVSLVLRATVLGLTCQSRDGRAEDNITLIAAREAGGGITSLTPRAGANSFSLVEQLGPNNVCPATQTITGRSGPVTDVFGAIYRVTLI
jgi:hypothetical protein